MRKVLAAAFLVRAVYYAGATAAFTLLFAFITGRLLLQRDWLTAAFPAAFTAALAFVTVRRYRLVRARFGAGDTAAPAPLGGAAEPGAR
jgi:hypothetical protein